MGWKADLRQRKQIPGIEFSAEQQEHPGDMKSLGMTGSPLTQLTGLPIRKGKRPITVRGPLHVQCSDNHEETLLDELVEEAVAWPGIEAAPWPVGSSELVSLRIAEDLASKDSANFISGNEFARFLFGAPTIYLALPLSCAHWAIVRGWAEPHYSGSFGLMPPGVMVVYTPRDEIERGLCRSLLLISYNCALKAGSSNSTESYLLRQGVKRSWTPEESVVAANAFVTQSRTFLCKPSGLPSS
jgi:hypothetical protein